MLIDASPRRLRRVLFTCVAVLVGLHLAMLSAGLPLPHEGSGIRAWFSLDAEANLPTLFATLQLVLASGLLLLLFVEARRDRRPRTWHWLALSAVFAFLALDEFTSIHERLIWPMKQLLGPGNILEFAWVLPYAGLVAVLALAFLGFWRDLPRQDRRAIALAAAVYVGGALVMETVGSFLVRYLGWASPLYALEVLLEETMELAGTALFVVALADLLGRRAGSVTLQLDTRAADRHRELMQDVEAEDRRRGERRQSAVR